jgi:hypothetical protein
VRLLVVLVHRIDARPAACGRTRSATK